VSPGPGAVAEVSFEDGEVPSAAVQAWSEAVDRCFDRLGWSARSRWIRVQDCSASLVLDAALDALYAATEINEWAVAAAGGRAPELKDFLTQLTTALEEESCPSMLSLQAEASRRDLPFVWDDDAVSVGMGRRSRTWTRAELPSVASVPWDKVGEIPIVYITGTNGKTTSTRMTARILQAAGHRPGFTSSDGVVVDGELIEKGDWTGPGAARCVLRHPDVDIAVLETARGGLLRRGLVVDQCDGALITNIASDHLGEYGVHSLEDMARVKGLVCRSVRPTGRRVLNADDPLLWKLGMEEGPQVTWFSVGPLSPGLRAHLDRGGEVWMLDDGWLCELRGQEQERVVEAAKIPATYGGTARHNVANALGAAALSRALGVSTEDIRRGLESFGVAAVDNPGRCQLELHRGIQVLLDFGHNPHGVRAMLSMARRLMADRADSRLWVSLGQAGDRSDTDLKDLAEAVWESRPHRISLREVAGYERGRDSGEVVGIMQDALIMSGHPASEIDHHPDEVSAMTEALKWAREGDLVVHLVHMQRDAVRSVLDA
jgi:cyanophycin synthetase